MANTLLALGKAELHWHAEGPNSCGPEAVFSILADTFGADQETAYSDYMELALQLQYALRTPVSV